jgi:hypothetical protein
MKVLQNKFVRSLPKVILFVIAFYNFAWVYWQNISAVGACVICPWYRETKDFPIDQFLLVTAAYILFIKNRWSYSLSVIISGYFSVSWILLITNWVWTTDYSLSQRFEIMNSQYYGNLLHIWESQIVIATAIFSFAIYYFVNEIFVKNNKKYFN